MNFVILNEDCLSVLKRMRSNSIDSIVTDPPYGLNFMGKSWDYDVPSVEIWKECLRVLKPGGHLLSFGGTRTYHRLVVAIEDAGFEIRDQIQWLYGQGFPKSQDISKAIDKAAGAEREVLGRHPNAASSLGNGINMEGGKAQDDVFITAPATDDAKKWSGWGTALKPANEPICLARKPLSESTIAKNVLKHGTGGLNIDGARIESFSDYHDLQVIQGGTRSMKFGMKERKFQPAAGRFPSNVILDEDAAQVLDKQTEHLHGAGSARKAKRECGETESIFGMGAGDGHRFGDSGGASRFFYVAKASKSDRNLGMSGICGDVNNHPTVKPVKLMEYLITLITPPQGIVLDPFAGSGTTGVAAKALGYGFCGIEKSPKYFKIMKARIGFDDHDENPEKVFVKQKSLKIKVKWNKVS